MDTAAISAALVAAIGAIAGAVAYAIRMYILRRAGGNGLINELVITEQDVEVGGQGGHPIVTVRSRGNTNQIPAEAISKANDKVLSEAQNSVKSEAQNSVLVIKKGEGEEPFTKKEAELATKVSKAWMTFSARRRAREAKREAFDKNNETPPMINQIPAEFEEGDEQA